MKLAYLIPTHERTALKDPLTFLHAGLVNALADTYADRIIVVGLDANHGLPLAKIEQKARRVVPRRRVPIYWLNCRAKRLGIKRNRIADEAIKRGAELLAFRDDDTLYHENYGDVVTAHFRRRPTAMYATDIREMGVYLVAEREYATRPLHRGGAVHIFRASFWSGHGVRYPALDAGEDNAMVAALMRESAVLTMDKKPSGQTMVPGLGQLVTDIRMPGGIGHATRQITQLHGHQKDGAALAEVRCPPEMAGILDELRRHYGIRVRK